MAANPSQTKAVVLMQLILNQDDPLKHSIHEDVFEKGAPMKLENQDDPLKYSVHEDAFEKGALEIQKGCTQKVKRGFNIFRK